MRRAFRAPIRHGQRTPLNPNDARVSIDTARPESNRGPAAGTPDARQLPHADLSHDPLTVEELGRRRRNRGEVEQRVAVNANENGPADRRQEDAADEDCTIDVVRQTGRGR